MEEQTNPSNDTTEQSVPKQETTFEEEETSPSQGTSIDPLTQIADDLSKLLVARSPREIDVSPYDGTFEAQSFFDNVDAQADRAELTYTDRLRKLPCYLQGKPLQYFRSLRLDRLYYNDARQTLIDLFPATTEASFARFLAIKMTPQMSLEDYYQNKTVMGMKLNLPTDILIESLTDGLPVADQRLIATVQPNTIKEWFDLVSRITQCATSAVYQRQVDKAPHPTYHNPPPRYNNQRSSRVTYQVTPPPSPCKYCNAMHWHSQCEQRFQQSRTRPVYSARPRTTTVPKRDTGASINILNLDILRTIENRLPYKIIIHQYSLTINAIANNVNTLGYIFLKLKIGNLTQKLIFFIVEASLPFGILSINTLKIFKLIIDFNNLQIYQNNDALPTNVYKFTKRKEDLCPNQPRETAIFTTLPSNPSCLHVAEPAPIFSPTVVSPPISPAHDIELSIPFNAAPHLEHCPHELHRILYEFSHVFSTNKYNVPKLNIPPVKINTTTDKIIALRPYRVPLHDQQEIQVQIEQMLQYGIITPSVSPYASPITLVTKRDKTKRFCIDYRKLNEIIAPDVHPLPLIETILDKLSKAKYYSSVDIASAYWQVEIEPNSRNLLAFVTLDSQYEFCRLPYGFKNSPQIYHRAINQVMQKYKLNFVTHYFDDFIIFSDTLEDHLQHLQQFLTVCQHENITLNYNKCSFFKTNIDFLGYTVTAGTYAPQTRNLDTINAIKPPTNQKTLQSFLGAVNVYNKFIADYARLRAPLNKLLKKDVKWNWDQDCQQAFTTLKESLTSKPVLHLYQVGLPCRLYCDASTQGIAGILKQVHPDGQVHPVQYFSRALRAHERNYTVSELECLAIVESVDKFRIYLTGIKFTIYTDHQALQWLKTIKNPSGRLFRWSLRLSTYNYEIHYLKGSQQYEADLLSRNPFVGFISADIIKQHQPTASTFNIDTNGLHTITRKGVTKIIIPETLQYTLMNKVHQEYNHPGISQMTRIITTQYYWKGISKSIEKFVRSCHTCQIIKRPKGKPYGALGQIPPPQQPFDLISIDTIAGFSKYGHSKTYLHVIVDHLTRYAWTFPSKSTSTLTYIQTLKTVLQQGFPKRLLSDRAPAFTSEKFRKFLIKYGIQPLLTTSNNPQANGLIERLNATITGKLRLAYLENSKASWTQLVKRVTQTYNNTPHSVTSFPPTYLMFNVVPPDLITHLNPYPEINIAREIARTRTQNKHKKDKETFDKQHRTPYFEVNDLVLVKNYRHPDTGKLAPYFTGPYKIIEIISPNVVRIDRPNQPLNRDSDTIHVNKLKYYTENVLYITPPHTRYVQKEQRMSPDVYLIEEAFDFYVETCLDITSWPELEGKLVSHFYKQEVNPFTAFIELKYDPEKGIGNYFKEKTSLASKAKISKENLIEGLTNGLTTDFRKLVITSKVDTPEEWIELVSKLEMIDRHKEMEESSFKRETAPRVEVQQKQWGQPGRSPMDYSSKRRPCRSCLNRGHAGRFHPENRNFNSVEFDEKLSPYEKSDLIKLIKENKEAFAAHKMDIGHIKADPIRIKLTSQTPISLKPFRPSFSDNIEIKRQIEELLKYNVIRPSYSSYASPAMLVNKRNEGKIRLVIDYRKLNDIIKRDSEPIPRIDSILDKLSDANIFTTLDLLSGYHHLDIHPDDKEYTAFTTTHGLYEFNKLSFGLKNSPSQFQRVLRQILNKYDVDFCMNYFDDFIIFSNNFQEHFTHLKVILDICIKENIKLKLSKCKFATYQISFLGYEISNHQFSPSTNNIETIRKLNSPRNKKDLQRVLGSINIYSKFIPNYAKLRLPLNNLLKKDVKWKWDEECETAFSKLKNIITSKPILAIYNPKYPIHLYTDASQEQIGSILKKKQWLPVNNQSHLNDIIVNINAKIAVLKEKIEKRHNNKIEFWMRKYDFPAISRKDDAVNVINLSKTVLSKDEVNILSKGLKHRPIGKPQTVKIISGIEAAIGKLNNYDKNTIRNTVINILKEPNKMPPNNHRDKAALNDLKNRQDIIITSADKGGMTVVMDKSDYINKMNNILEDRTIFTIVDEINKKREYSYFKKEINRMAKSNMISNDEFKLFMSNLDSESYIYGKPKVHKQGIPLRPIVAYHSSPLAPIARIINGYFKQMKEEVIEKAKLMKRLYNLKSLQCFTGFTGHFRAYIPNYAKIVRPLDTLKKKDSSFMQSDKCEEAYLKLIDIITSKPILAIPDESLPYEMSTDASYYGTGAILYQRDMNKRRSLQLRVISYYSYTFSKAEQHYSITEKECLALLKAVKYFRWYLEGKSSVFHTDNRAFILKNGFMLFFDYFGDYAMVPSPPWASQWTCSSPASLLEPQAWVWLPDVRSGRLGVPHSGPAQAQPRFWSHRLGCDSPTLGSFVSVGLTMDLLQPSLAPGATGLGRLPDVRSRRLGGPHNGPAPAQPRFCSHRLGFSTLSPVASMGL
ncbi:hypothetical protein LAZ67_3005743, partial [Cordylochernes scorpioides]